MNTRILLNNIKFHTPKISENEKLLEYIDSQLTQCTSGTDNTSNYVSPSVNVRKSRNGYVMSDDELRNDPRF